MEVGDLPVLAEEEAQRMLCEVFLFAGYCITLYLYFFSSVSESHPGDRPHFFL